MTVPEERVTFFKSQFDAILKLPEKDEQLNMFIAVFNYMFYGIEPDFSDAPYLDGMFISWLPVFNKSAEYRRIARENGKKGGAPVGNQNARKHETTSGLNGNKLNKNENKGEGYDNEDPAVSYRDEKESGGQSIDVSQFYVH
jgi:hypothetical protein